MKRHLRSDTTSVWIGDVRESTQKLRLKLKPGHESGFLAIFQQGVYLETQAGLPLAQVLEEAGFSRKYLEDKVQTVFLDGSAVDDLDSAIVEGGSVIALSAAMPGLAGAILRKGSPILALRSKTASETGGPRRTGDTLHAIRLKLFNMIAVEIGPGLLRKGILVKRSDFEDFLSSRRGLPEDAVLEAELDGAPVSPAELFGGKSIGSDYIALQTV